jgi:hypothetical protein
MFEDIAGISFPRMFILVTASAVPFAFLIEETKTNAA